MPRQVAMVMAMARRIATAARAATTRHAPEAIVPVAEMRRAGVPAAGRADDPAVRHAAAAIVAVAVRAATVDRPHPRAG